MQANFQGNYSPFPPRMQSMPNVAQDRPAYRILKPCFLDDVMFFEGQLVYWDEIPNKEMEPLNDLAKKATNDFFDEIDRLARIASAKKQMRYIPLRRPIEEERAANNAEARRVELIKGDGGVPIMGARKRGRPKAQVVEVSAMEEKVISDPARISRRNISDD